MRTVCSARNRFELAQINANRFVAKRHKRRKNLLQRETKETVFLSTLNQLQLIIGARDYIASPDGPSGWPASLLFPGLPFRGHKPLWQAQAIKPTLVIFPLGIAEIERTVGQCDGL